MQHGYVIKISKYIQVKNTVQAKPGELRDKFSAL
jgi:hypothetical protein